VVSCEIMARVVGFLGVYALVLRLMCCCVC